MDEPDNPVEWIVSVAMLTEGWDVKNVFQIVPHENKAFNSKLLIAQVLGRGLRVPPGVDPPVLVKVNNHERWTPEIENLYRDILEIENVLSWGYTPAQEPYVFPLHNLRYESVQQTTETKRKPASEPETVDFAPQSREWTETSRYSHSGPVATLIENRRIMSIPNAVRQMKIFLKEKNEGIAREWTSRKVRAFLEKNLKRCGCDPSFISTENLARAQQAFGPMLRGVEETNPRMTLKAQELVPVDMREVARQHFTESVRGFYSFPYSYKPSRIGRSHVKQDNFNPDFFLKLAGQNEILVVEIKQDGDEKTRNRAKNRDGKRHFEEINARLEATGKPWRYRFYFLSPKDYPEFFSAIRDQRHVEWKSSLMLALEA